MVPTLVSSNPHIFFDEAHGVQPTTLLDLDEQPAVLVDKALQTMKREGIQVIEWRALLYRRMKVPVFVKNFHYVVPDNQLESASACLSNLGLPLMPLSDFRINVDGDFHLKGKFHRITVGTESWDLQQIALYPLSFSTLSMSELTEEPPMRLYPSQRCPKILIPRPSAVYASFIRLASQYIPSHPMWINLLSEISQLIGYHLYELSQGFVDIDDDKVWEELEMDKRLEKAYLIVIGWGCDGEWRKGEE